MSALADLLRSPARVAERCREDREVRELALVSLGAIVLGAAVFGAAAGIGLLNLVLGFAGYRLLKSGWKLKS